MLGQTGIEVSALGYGCTQLTTLTERRDAVALLERAFAEGITHFDVARAYGFGRAEGILGEFLRGKRDQVTIATKFGLQPPSGLAGNRRVIDAIKRLLRPFPGLLQRARNQGSAMSEAGIFTPAVAVESLETSLRELGTDYVDIFFLHEATLSDARNEALMETLQAQVAKGKIKLLGIASGFEKLNGDASLLPAQYQVIQFDDSVVSRNLPKLAHRDDRAVIRHGIFNPFTMLQTFARKSPDNVLAFQMRTKLDLADSSVLGSLLLHYALHGNSGPVLFSSANPARIAANVRDASTGRFDDAQLRDFTAFVDTCLAAQPASS